MSDKVKTYGLIGKDLKHSFSPKYFEQKFENEGVKNAVYLAFPLKSIIDYFDLSANKIISGLNVTIPYKEEIIPFLDELSEDVNKIQAVNTIVFKENGKTIGYNTDILGFEQSFKPLLKPHHKKALIFGTGGASKAVVFVLNKLNIPFELVSRTKTNLKYYDIDKNVLKEYQILINTTPLGMFPNLKEKVDIEYAAINENHMVYDLVYNPLKTQFLRNAEKQGAAIKNGLEMLEIQAEEAWKLWQ